MKSGPKGPLAGPGNEGLWLPTEQAWVGWGGEGEGEGEGWGLGGWGGEFGVRRPDGKVNYANAAITTITFQISKSKTPRPIWVVQMEP